MFECTISGPWWNVQSSELRVLVGHSTHENRGKMPTSLTPCSTNYKPQRETEVVDKTVVHERRTGTGRTRKNLTGN